MKVLSVFGTRPEAIKMAPVIRALGPASVVCVTGQHRQLLDQVLTLFDIQVDHDLNLMRPSQSPTDVMAGVLTLLPPLLRQICPDVVLVQGDTSSTLAASMAAFLEHIPVGHVEAGLRTYDLQNPFPEEMNRVLVSRLATLHFAPTERAGTALLREGYPHVMVTGNTGIDALLQMAAPSPSRDPIVLVTMHRRESIGAPMRAVCAALRELSECQFVFPVHPSPPVQEAVHSLRGVSHVSLVDPLDYREFVHLLARSCLVLTDSGGVQEEAPSLGIPVLVLRDVTERPEGVEAGTAVLVGTDQGRIVSTVRRLLASPDEYRKMSTAVNPYGDGRASERIVAALHAYLS